jgi:hypothetical protein
MSPANVQFIVICKVRKGVQTFCDYLSNSVQIAA